ncbi:MAG: hypothetical protein ABI851_12160 [Saprospiraceae bacterium]
MESKLDKSKERIVDRFFKELGIEHPSEEQVNFVSQLDRSELTKPIIRRMIENGKSYGTIAISMNEKIGTIKQRCTRLKQVTKCN